MVKKCLNCNFEVNLPEKAYLIYGSTCPKCENKMIKWEVKKVSSMTRQERVVQSINKWFGELGIEGTLEMIEGMRHLPYLEYFQIELFNRGFNLVKR